MLTGPGTFRHGALEGTPTLPAQRDREPSWTTAL